MGENIFLGLQPYTEADAYRFKGRRVESQELFRLIVRNDYTVCYAESGEGKTSLLNAGVIPLLRENMFFPIAITFTSDDYQYTPDSFDSIIDRCIRDSIKDYNDKNKGINIEYRLCTTDFQDTGHCLALQQELSKFSWWKLRNYKPQAIGLTFIPVFVFDQFEEIFNMPGSNIWIKRFFDWLEDVSSDSCPDYIARKIRDVIGIDATFPFISEQKGFKAVFCLRKEFIGELDYWCMQRCFIPSLKDNRYCLKDLTYEGAKEVMSQMQLFDEVNVKTVLDYFVKKYSREPEKTIAEGLPIIPALLLSIVCDSLEKDISFFFDIDFDGIDQLLDRILEKFYDDTIDAVVNELFRQEPDITITTIRENIELAIFALVDGNGKRVRRKSSELSCFDFDTKYKILLVSKRILKISKIDGEDYVEIVHDAICPVIAKKKQIFLTAESVRHEEERLKYQAVKNRKQLIVAAVICFTVIGVLSFFLWQNNRFIKEQEARSLSEAEKDSIAKLNNSLTEQVRINEVQRGNISELNLLLSKQNDSLENYLIIRGNLFEALNRQSSIIELKNDSLNNLLAMRDKQLSENKLLADSLQHALSIKLAQDNYIHNKDNVDNVVESITKENMVSRAQDVCLKMRDAFENNDFKSLEKYSDLLRTFNCSDFNSFRCCDDGITSVSGHFLYNPSYIDALIKGDDGKNYLESEVRGAISNLFSNGTSILFMKNCCVGFNKTTKYTFAVKGYTNFAAIAEPFGFIILRIYDKTNNQWCNNVKNNGKASQYESIFPSDKITELEVEIINCTNKAISFVVLTN